MSDTPEPGPTPYVRLPWQLVAGGLLVLLVGLLAFGLYANGNLRPGAAAAPTPTPPPAATATRVPVVAPTATLAPTPLIITLLSTPTTIPAPATVTAQPAATATGLPTVEPTLVAEVSRDYENFWRVTSQALLELDTTHLTEVMDADYLTNITNRISELRTEGRAIKTHVLLNYSVLKASSASAEVFDALEDDSVYVKIGTEDPLSDPTADQLRITYELRMLDGVWKVVDSVRVP